MTNSAVDEHTISITLTCGGCGAKLPLGDAFSSSPDFMDIATPAYKQGWRMARAEWFCSVDCVIGQKGSTA